MPSGPQIRTMFSGIARRYDLLNHVLSFGLDGYWWRRMARASGAGPGHLFLDVAAGTGDSTVALARRGARVVSSDFTLAMLSRGPQKFKRQTMDEKVLASIGADAQTLPFRAGVFDGVTICYGIRNVEDRAKAFTEFRRVLKPGGTLTVLEFSQPRWMCLRWAYNLYSRWMLPRIGGWLSGDTAAYDYLPESIRGFPGPEALVTELAAAGFEKIQWKPLTGGIAALHLGRRPLTQSE
jgi:demethylmenaquinone methyltransferase / 2-methoxy-6-polyprenyl-1,4-benzoquinol methylase